MNLESYIERQDRTFDTFRTKFSLGPSNDAPSERRDGFTSPKRRDRTTSSATFREFLVSIDHEEAEVQSPREPSPSLSFAPQIRRLDVAPWEDYDEAFNDRREVAKKSRRGIFSKFMRKSTRSAKRRVQQDATSQVDLEEEVSALDGSLEATRPTTASETKSVSLVSSKQSVSQTSTSIHSPVVPLGQPLGAEVGPAIAFGPVDPNILHLRQPVGTIAEDGEYKVMKPSLSTPQIQYELETPTKKQDRMSRMFDGLNFS